MRHKATSVFLVALALTACQNMPTSTRSGDVIDVFMGDRPATFTFDIKVGDEIRWTNTGPGSVRIVLPDRIINQVTCRRNVSGYFTGGLEMSLAPHESASLCFGNSGTIRYTTTMQSTSLDAQVSQEGLIQVDISPEHPAS